MAISQPPERLTSLRPAPTKEFVQPVQLNSLLQPIAMRRHAMASKVPEGMGTKMCGSPLDINMYISLAALSCNHFIMLVSTSSLSLLIINTFCNRLGK